MKKRSHQSTNIESSATSPSSSSSSSSSSSCVVNDHLIVNNHGGDEEKPPKPKRIRRKTVSINKNLKNQKCTVNANANANAATPNPNPPSNRRSSIYRGVTRHRWTGRFEAHLWDKSCWNNVQNKKGRQVYLGAYDSEVDAARTYDLAALKYWGPETTLNFPIENYTKELEEMQNASKEEYLASLRRRSSGFSRGVSKYRGVARHHHNGRWEARIGRVFGNKYLYLGTFSSQEEAAAAYDRAAIEYRGPNAVTNFDISNYIGRVKNLMPKGQSAQPNPAQAKATLPQKKQKQLIKQQNEEEQQDDQPEIKIQPDLEDQVEGDQQDQLIDVPCHKLEESKLINSMDHPSILAGMDVPEDERENPWSFCLDTGGYDPLLVLDVPFEEDGKLLDLFDETGFEENIDMIFDGEAGNLISMDGTYYNDTEVIGCQTRSNTPEDLKKKVGSSPKAEENLLSFSSSSPSSPSSITSVVSCQV